MQAVKIQIPGDYWDSQIANGRLYLFGRSGDIRVLDWDRLTNGLVVDASLKPELNWALSRNAALYRARASLGYPAADTWEAVKSKFSILEAQDLEVHTDLQSRYLISQIDNRFPFPHRDSAFEGKQLIIAGQNGLYKAKLSVRSGSGFLETPERLWDGPAFSVKANAKNLAIAAGDEGLYQFHVGTNSSLTGRFGEMKKLSDKNSVDCGWAFRSIYGSSFKAPGYLIPSWIPATHRNRGPNERIGQPQEIGDFNLEQSLHDLIPEEEIFKERGYSWACRDSICQVEGNTVRIVRYSPRARKRERVLKDMGRIEITGWKGEVVSACVAVFGIVIECEQAVVIKLSTEDVLTLPGEVVRFRIFPESPEYENQLHLIYEDRLDILAFTHDYFVNQQSKLIGYRRLVHAKSTPDFA